MVACSPRTTRLGSMSPWICRCPPNQLSVSVTLSSNSSGMGNAQTQTHRLTDSQTHRHKHKHTDTQTQTHRHAHRDKQTHRHTHGHTETNTDAHRDTQRHTHRDTHRRTHRHRHRDRHTHTHRHRQTQTDRQTDRHTQTDTDTHRHTQTDTHTDRHRQTQTDTDRAVTLKSSSLHCGVAARNPMVSHRRSAKERRAQRSRAEARFIGRILRGCFELAVRRGAKAGDIISSLADNLRGRPPTKREHKEMYQQTDPDAPVILVSAATQTEDPVPSVLESSVETGTTLCTVPDDMQTEESFPSAVHQSPIQDVPLLAANVTEPWQAPPRRRVRRKRNIASTSDDDDDALLNAAIISATQERSELANTVAHQVEQLQQEVHRVGLVCP